MAATDTLAFTPATVLAALGLGPDATRAEIIAAAEALEGKAPPTAGEVAQLAALRKALGLASNAMRSEVLKAIKAKIPTAAETATFAAPSAAMSRVALAMGLPADTPGDVIVAKTRAAVALSQVDKAISERRVHRAQRGQLIELARHDFALFQGFLATATETIGYASAEEEFAALVEQRVRSNAGTAGAVAAPQSPSENEPPPASAPRDLRADVRASNALVRSGTETIRAHNEQMRSQAAPSEQSFAAVQQAIAAEHPDLAAEVSAERRGVNRADQVSAAASAALAVAFSRLVDAGKTPYEAITLLARDHTELVIARTSGQEPGK